MREKRIVIRESREQRAGDDGLCTGFGGFGGINLQK
jgi:hypothetical protein